MCIEKFTLSKAFMSTTLFLINNLSILTLSDVHVPAQCSSVSPPYDKIH